MARKVGEGLGRYAFRKLKMSFLPYGGRGLSERSVGFLVRGLNSQRRHSERLGNVFPSGQMAEERSVMNMVRQTVLLYLQRR